uniref:NADH-ubiquinone oxidoreductase chain 4 n=1 Tax=Aesalus sp. JL-2019 TaxID=2565995 RepID=A0A7L4VDX1_9SCAR|nr:NADH dehydrogenase subunit 4 [Aesalus sp. JL-2019]
MMKFFFFLIFMVPLSFVKGGFWIFQYLFFVSTFIFYSLYNCSSLFFYISNIWGIDLLSFVMILLSFWICSLMIMASESLLKSDYFPSFFLLMILLLMFSLYCTFSSMNLFVFYLFFEMSLIPTLILIVGWGHQPERMQAGIYLMFYTLFASLPMMISIFYYYLIYSSLDYYYFFKGIDLVLFYFCINMAFFVKMPMYLVHLWLPKAHVEAPVSGSMILAGVMLKLGGYGMLRLMSTVVSVAVKMNFYFILISLVGGFLVSLICLRQSDMKSLVAYSSVAHMGLVLGGIMTINYWGLCGSLVMMIAHGLCSSGLFCLVNISYERLMSRSLFLNKGLINIMPGMTLWWFLLCSSNMAAPPSFNLLGEIMLINSLISWSWVTMIMLSLISFFSAIYSLYLYAYSQHGKVYSGIYIISGGLVREYLLLFLHWFPLNILIMKAVDFTSWL